jgi:hypothetical protein
MGLANESNWTADCPDEAFDAGCAIDTPPRRPSGQHRDSAATAPDSAGFPRRELRGGVAQTPSHRRRLPLTPASRLAAKRSSYCCAGSSDDNAMPVLGKQTKMAEEPGWGDRSAGRYRAELETLGDLTVYRATPQRGPARRSTRRQSNIYYLKISGRADATRPAPRRRARTSFSVLPHRRPGQYAANTGHPQGNAHNGVVVSARLPDNHDRSSPFGGATTGGSPPTNTRPRFPSATNPPGPAARHSAQQRFRHMRALLKPAPGVPLVH